MINSLRKNIAAVGVVASLALLSVAATLPTSAAVQKISNGPILTVKEKTALQAILATTQIQAKGIGNNKALSLAEKQSKFKALYVSYQAKRLAVLTPAQRQEVADNQKIINSGLASMRAIDAKIKASLTATQKAKLKAISVSANTRIQKLIADKSLTVPVKQVQAGSIQRSVQAQMTAILTPAQRAEVAQINAIHKAITPLPAN